MGTSKKKKSSTTRKRRFVGIGSILALCFLAIGIFMIAQTFSEQQIDRFLNGGITGYSNDEIPEQYVSIYQAAAEEYDIPWQVLPAVHRVETKFSTMDPMVSPVGAEGHMQFMPCTWHGWNHPTCDDVGAGDIPNVELKNPDQIESNGGYGVDATGSGTADPWDERDAIFSTANFLAANGANDSDMENALYMYNRSGEYVEEVMAYYDIYMNEGYEIVDKNE
ncbi:lytic transglycosylase domain-containing protein [Salicibibacter halophilus]|uniref:Lytic transglycosylase domain-containing protein n=1 Tax=Salicibibacter halophilus TaxID=2502791 RepID=A0A514LLF5_9BACI|nr:lytic transglycosylase domain-containing protein [Salicibibacter halophilus]QDI92699.1 lytic transglycosylase domain-containing protein [Salicibibacter halophilus]